jgi:Domain of unknown function (DUF4350)
VRRRWRIGIVVVAAVVAFDVVLHVLGTLTGGTPGGPDSSAYSTGSTGVRAYAELLGRYGHPVERLRTTPSQSELAAGDTVFLLDPPSVAARDADALRKFVLGGGRLVAGGRAGAWTRALVERPPSGTTAGVVLAHPLPGTPRLRGIETVRTAREASWSDAGSARPLLGAASRVVLATARAGRGEVFLLADTSPLENRLLGTRDNAALGLALAGRRGSNAVFLETYHGYGRSAGLRALPFRWKVLLTGIGLAALVYLVARGRRLGPPESRRRDLGPPRHAYVDAVAAVVARTRRREEAVAPVRRRARSTLLRRAGLPEDADDDALRAAARRLGVPAADVEALLRPARTDADVVAVGRALAGIGQDPAL